jgi:serine protease AprX
MKGHDPGYQAHAHKFDPFLAEKISLGAQSEEMMDVLVQYEGDDQVSSISIELSQENGYEIITELPTLAATVVRAPQSAVLKLASHPHIKKLYLDRPVRALLDKAIPTIGLKQPEWNSTYTGKGITIAILDTGITPHADLTTPRNRIVGFHDLINGRTVPYDDHGHGTHVAGCAAANGITSGGKYRAPAYEACIVGVKVLDETGVGSISKIVKAVEWCIANKEKLGIRILSLSLGAPFLGDYRDDPLCRILEIAWEKGLVVVVAAGNNGPGKSTVTAPGVDPVVITVGASDDKNTDSYADDEVALFSSRGPTRQQIPKPDIVAPGKNIISLRSPGSYLDRTQPSLVVDRDYFQLSGTSMATPICSGVVALLLEARPESTPDEIKEALLQGAKDIFHDSDSAGYGYLDPAGALRFLQEKEKIGACHLSKLIDTVL